MLEEGALPHQIDKVVFDYGFPMGPFAMSDLAGNDVGWRIRQGKKEKEQRNVRYTGYIADAICELGRFGQKTGAGMYLYPDGRTPEVDPRVTELIVAESARLGIARRAIGVRVGLDEQRIDAERRGGARERRYVAAIAAARAACTSSRRA